MTESRSSADAVDVLRSEFTATEADPGAWYDHGRFDLSWLLPASPLSVLEIGGDRGLGAVATARRGHDVAFLPRDGDGLIAWRRFEAEGFDVDRVDRLDELSGRQFDAVICRSPSRDPELRALGVSKSIEVLLAVLNPGGRLILADRNSMGWPWLLGRADPATGRRFSGIGVHWSPGSVARAARRSGAGVRHQFAALPHDRALRLVAPTRWHGAPADGLVSGYEQLAGEVPGRALPIVAKLHRVLPHMIASALVPASVQVIDRGDDVLPCVVEELAGGRLPPIVFNGKALADTVTVMRRTAGGHTADFVKLARNQGQSFGPLCDLVDLVASSRTIESVAHERLDVPRLGTDAVLIGRANGRVPVSADLSRLAVALGDLHRATELPPRPFATTQLALGRLDGHAVLADAAAVLDWTPERSARLARLEVPVSSCHFDWGRRNARVRADGTVVGFDWDLGSQEGAAPVDAAIFLLTEVDATARTLADYHHASGVSLTADHLDLALAVLAGRWDRASLQSLVDRADCLRKQLPVVDSIS